MLARVRYPSEHETPQVGDKGEKPAQPLSVLDGSRAVGEDMQGTGKAQDSVPPGRLRVVICDDHRTLREALRAYLVKQSGIGSVAIAADADDAVRMVRAGADVLVLDLLLGHGSSSFDVLEAVRHLGLRVAVLMLSVTEDVDLVSRAIRLGADGFCSKHVSADVLYDAVRTVARGQVFLPDSLVAPVGLALVERRRSRVDDKQLLMRVTPREREVLLLLAHGNRRDEIARRLGLSPNTIRTHIGSLMRKLGVHTEVAAAALGRRLFGLQPEAHDVATAPDAAPTRGQGRR